MNKPRIDFVTPIPLITCLARLPKEYIHPTGKGDYDIDTTHKGNISLLQIRLHLSSQDMETHIKGGVYVAGFTYLIPIIVGMVLAFVGIQISGLPFLCVSIVFGITVSLFLLIRYERYLAEKRLLDVFQHFKHKKKTFAWWGCLVFPAIKLQREVPLSLYDLTNKLYRLHYETNYVEMRERKERYFVINRNGARIFGWMRVIDSEQTAIQYWVGFDLLGLVASVSAISLVVTLLVTPSSLDDTGKVFIGLIGFYGIFGSITTLYQCFRLWRKFRTVLNTVELKDWSLLQSLN
jgi:hypothetical protein